MTKPGLIRVALSHLWRVPVALAFVVLGLGVALWIRPTWPVGEIVVDSPSPIAAPLSSQPVCAYHICVEHPRGSTCLGRVWAESIEFTAPDGKTAPGKVRWNAPAPEYDIIDGATQSAFGELLVETDSERVTTRCNDAACTWSEKLVPCGSSHTARWRSDEDIVYVQRERAGLEGIATAWFVMLGFVVLLIVSLPLRWAFRIRH